MDSPLRQQARPDVLKPKVVTLYETLFQNEHTELSEGFWRELFLLKPDRPGLQNQIQRLSVEDVLHGHQHACEQLFLHSLAPPVTENALDTLAIFLENILNKRYGSPGADIITVLAGLDDVDTIFADFVTVLDDVIRTGKSVVLRTKAVRVATIAVAGMYQTSLVSYFIDRDLFPALMKSIQESDSVEVTQAVAILLGLLLNYQKGEFLSPYRTRLEDFVSSNLITNIVLSYISILEACRDQYTVIQDDQVETMGIGSALSWLGFNRLTSTAQQPSASLTEEQAATAFSGLPPSSMSTLLLLYDFSLANKLFRLELVTKPISPNGPSVVPLTSFISSSSYLFQHAHRSSRASSYACLNLLILNVLLSDLDVARRVCSADNAVSVRLCRQRAPALPAVKGDRILGSAMIDAISGGIQHNLRQRLDAGFYSLLLSVLIRLFTFLAITRTKLDHNYAPLFSSLFALVRFLTTHAAIFASLPSCTSLIQDVVGLLSLLLSAGEKFFPTPGTYDDLLYKVIESADTLISFSSAYSSSLTSGNSNSDTHIRTSARVDMDFILAVSTYCQNLINGANGGKGLSTTAGVKEVIKVIRQGYEGLQTVIEDHRRDVGSAKQLAALEKYREGQWRGLVKRISRVVVVDARAAVMASVS